MEGNAKMEIEKNQVGFGGFQGFSILAYGIFTLKKNIFDLLPISTKGINTQKMSPLATNAGNFIVKHRSCISLDWNNRNKTSVVSFNMPRVSHRMTLNLS